MPKYQPRVYGAYVRHGFYVMPSFDGNHTSVFHRWSADK